MRSLKLPLAAAAVLLASGCSRGPFNAPFSASISADIDTIYVANAPTFWFEDGIGAAIKMRLLVTDTDNVSGEPVPLNNVWVEVQGPTRGVFLLPQQAVQTISYPSAGQGDCEDPNTGERINSGENEWCGWWQDTDSTGAAGNYVQIAPSYADAAGYTEDGQAYGPNFLKQGTDRYGRLELWVFVDAMPITNGDPTNARRDAPALDTGHGGTDGTDGTGGTDEVADVEIGEALIIGSIGHDSTTVTVTGAD